jgi:transporter family-2 protein
VDRGTAIALTGITGGLVALQAPLNSGLGKEIGTWSAALVNFLVGTVVLLAIVAVAEGFGDWGGVRRVSWIYLTAGILGALYVTSILVSVRHIGVGGVTVVTVAAQIVASAIVDHYGLLGVDKQPISVARVAGFALVAAGTVLVVRE